MIPLLELKQVNGQHQDAIESALLRVARSGKYILGPELETFERSWAEYVEASHCVGTANALEAMQIALLTLGIGPGDEVIVPSNTYIATWLAVTHTGARPVPVEPDTYTFNIDPTRLREAVTPRTRAVLSVHLYGHPAPMDRIRAAVPDVWHIADAAQAHGALCHFDNGEVHAVGSDATGDATCFSFYPSKNLGALGDCGAITTRLAGAAATAARMRNYGGVGRVDHQIVGINSRLDEIQAAVLSAKLPYLYGDNMMRTLRASMYDHGLIGVPVRRPPRTPGSVYHQYVLRSPKRDYIVERAAALGVDLHVHYPVPPHLEGAYRDLGFKAGDFPLAEMLASQVFSLPIGYDFDQHRVISVLRQTIKECA